MKILGVTGSIGMGKSTVSGMLQDLGVPVHDSDATVHKLLAAGGAGVAPVGALFPQAVQRGADGRDYIDRPSLGRLVFGHPELKSVLEDILHPLVRQDADAFVASMRGQGCALVALDIPLLFETGGEDRVDAVLCVTADAETQRARVLARPGMTPEKFAHILGSQLPDAEKRRRADYIVTTDTTLDETRKQVAALVQQIAPGLQNDGKCGKDRNGKDNNTKDRGPHA